MSGHSKFLSRLAARKLVEERWPQKPLPKRKEPFVDEPDVVTTNGTKLWLDEASTGYARKDMIGQGGKITAKGLETIYVYNAELSDGERTIVVFENEEAIKDFTSLEALGAWLDIQKVART